MGFRADFKQFITEMSLCLPPTICLMRSFFSSTTDYIFYAQTFNAMHHLLIGEDLPDESDGLMDRVDMAARKVEGVSAISLFKRQKKAPLSQFDQFIPFCNGL